jgi:hypothetical protein
MSLLWILILGQGALIIWDELYFHRRRGLGRWERVGHPLDSMGMALCLGFLYFSQPHPEMRAMYSVLAVASCLGVTKDEWIHAKQCQPPEQWLHACLFLLHSAILVTAFFSWTAGAESRTLLLGACGALGLGILQIGIWSTAWRERLPR